MIRQKDFTHKIVGELDGDLVDLLGLIQIIMLESVIMRCNLQSKVKTSRIVSHSDNSDNSDLVFIHSKNKISKEYTSNLIILESR